MLHKSALLILKVISSFPGNPKSSNSSSDNSAMIIKKLLLIGLNATPLQLLYSYYLHSLAAALQYILLTASLLFYN